MKSLHFAYIIGGISLIPLQLWLVMPIQLKNNLVHFVRFADDQVHMCQTTTVYIRLNSLPKGTYAKQKGQLLLSRGSQSV